MGFFFLISGTGKLPVKAKIVNMPAVWSVTATSVVAPKVATDNTFRKMNGYVLIKLYKNTQQARFSLWAVVYQHLGNSICVQFHLKVM